VVFEFGLEGSCKSHPLLLLSSEYVFERWCRCCVFQFRCRGLDLSFYVREFTSSTARSPHVDLFRLTGRCVSIYHTSLGLPRDWLLQVDILHAIIWTLNIFARNFDNVGSDCMFFTIEIAHFPQHLSTSTSVKNLLQKMKDLSRCSGGTFQNLFCLYLKSSLYVMISKQASQIPSKRNYFSEWSCFAPTGSVCVSIRTPSCEPVMFL